MAWHVALVAHGRSLEPRYEGIGSICHQCLRVARRNRRRPFGVPL